MKPLYQLPGEAPTLRKVARRYLAIALYLDVLAFWIATQAAAHRLDFHAALGKPWLVQELLPVPLALAGAALCGVLTLVALLGHAALPRSSSLIFAPPTLALAALSMGPLYSPAHLLLWAHRFGNVEVLASLLLPWRSATFLAGAAIALVALVAAFLVAPAASKPDVHGSARFAKRQDLERVKLLHPVKRGTVVGPPGLFLGCWTDGSRKYSLYDAADTHAFVFAPTRSGKGVPIVIPNLLLWPGSALVVDVKSEIYHLTAGYRSRELASPCLRFDPTSPATTRYNPLAEIRLGDNEVRDAQNVADILVDLNGDRTRDHWDRTAHALLTAVILHVVHVEPDKTLRGCATLLSTPGTEIEKTLQRMAKSAHLPTGPHPVIASLIQAVLDKAKEERSGVVSTALSFLDLYRDPLIAANTAASDFRIEDLMQHERPVTLYLTLPPSDLSRTRPLVRLLLNQVCRRLTEPALQFVEGQPKPHYKHQLLLVMDELTALGRLHFFAEALAYLAGYGIRCLLVAQDLAQLQGAYGRSESLTSNAHFRMAFAPNKPETAELISQLAGQTTVHQQRHTRRAGGPLAPTSGSVTPSESSRRLITPDEVMRLPADQAFSSAQGFPQFEDSKLPISSIPSCAAAQPSRRVRARPWFRQPLGASIDNRSLD